MVWLSLMPSESFYTCWKNVTTISTSFILAYTLTHPLATLLHTTSMNSFIRNSVHISGYAPGQTCIQRLKETKKSYNAFCSKSHSSTWLFHFLFLFVFSNVNNKSQKSIISTNAKKYQNYTFKFESFFAVGDFNWLFYVQCPMNRPKMKVNISTFDDTQSVHVYRHQFLISHCRLYLNASESRARTFINTIS